MIHRVLMCPDRRAVRVLLRRDERCSTVFESLNRFGRARLSAGAQHRVRVFHGRLVLGRSPRL